MADVPAVPTTTASEPEPAKPILASHLLDLEEQQRARFTRHGKPERLSTGCAEIDALLGGNGLERGIVLGLSAEGGHARLISLNLLASVLLSHLSSTSLPPKTRASIIDTSGTFPVALLAKILTSRIAKERQRAVFSGDAASDGRQASTSSISDDVQKCLEMVGISRVFDVEGLWEVVGEIRSTAKTSLEVSEPLDDREETQSPREEDVEIADSEDEEDEISTPVQGQNQTEIETQQEDEGIEIIIIDNMTQIINELFTRKERSDAHTLLALLSKTLTTLTRTSNILTILHNNTVPNTSFKPTHPSNQSSKTNNYNYNFPNPHEVPPHDHRQTNPNRTTQPTSLFPSNPTKPALGQIFTQFPSLHVSLSQLPKTTRDAELLYGGNDIDNDIDFDNYNAINNNQAIQPPTAASTIKHSTVLEILKDETPSLSTAPHHAFAYREGTWCAVDVDSTGLVFISAFADKGSRQGLALEKVKQVLGERTSVRDAGLGREGEEGVAGTERLTGRGVSNVAKIYGFGGRRV